MTDEQQGGDVAHAVMYLLGKMDGLRFPNYSINMAGTPSASYPKAYIEELLGMQRGLLEHFEVFKRPKGE